MLGLEHIREIAQKTPSKIVLLVMDGLGGLPDPRHGGKSELETARKPHLDAIAAQSSLGLLHPVMPGVTPGSGPGHLGLFGYDPVKHLIKRGIMEALGIDLEVRGGDVTARGNFCTIDSNGVIVDRRAGRIATETCADLCRTLNTVKMPGVELMVHPVKEHRFVLQLRGKGPSTGSGQGLSDEMSDADPNKEGLKPLRVKALSPQAEATAAVVNSFVEQAGKLLAGQSKANFLLLRGFSQQPQIPQMRDVFKLTPAAIAVYPMYRGLAKLVGMDLLPTGTTVEDEIETLRKAWDRYDYFFVHYKATDSAGEDGDFDRKVQAIEALDAALPRLWELKPDVLVVTGDHSTPSVLKGHSWHPVPVLLSSCYCFPDGMPFTERSCARGTLGHMEAQHLMMLALGNALKLTKYGA